MEVAFLGHIVGRAGLACDPGKVSVVRAWHSPGSVKQVRQFVGFIGYYRRFIQNQTLSTVGGSNPEGSYISWTMEHQVMLDTLKAPTEEGRFILNTDASLFAVGGVLNQLQDDREVVIAYASLSLRLSQRLYCTTRREMLAAVSMYTHFRLYLWGAQFTLRTDHRSLRWLQNFRNSDGMLARWYMLLGQFSLTFKYRPETQHANDDGLSRQCVQCLRPVSSPEGQAGGASRRGKPEGQAGCSGSTSALLDQLFASSAMGDSMDAVLLPELSGETWVTATYLE